MKTSFSFTLDTLVEICQTTGVLLDSVYTVKAVKGMVTEMNDNPNRFKGNRVLFLHTGKFGWNYWNYSNKHSCTPC